LIITISKLELFIDLPNQQSRLSMLNLPPDRSCPAQ